MVAAASTFTQPWPVRGSADPTVIAVTRAAQLNSRYVTGFRCRRARTPADMAAIRVVRLAVPAAPNWLVWVTGYSARSAGPSDRRDASACLVAGSSGAS